MHVHVINKHVPRFRVHCRQCAAYGVVLLRTIIGTNPRGRTDEPTVNLEGTERYSCSKIRWRTGIE